MASATASGPAVIAGLRNERAIAASTSDTAAVSAELSGVEADIVPAAVSPRRVTISPGSMIETCTPNGAVSIRSASDTASTACLDAWWIPPNGNVRRRVQERVVQDPRSRHTDIA